MSSKGVVAIVGCGLGLGGAIAAKFASEGYSIAAMARSQKSLDYVKEMLAKAGTGATHGFYTMDATNKEDIDAALQDLHHLADHVELLHSEALALEVGYGLADRSVQEGVSTEDHVLTPDLARCEHLAAVQRDAAMNDVHVPVGAELRGSEDGGG